MSSTVVFIDRMVAEIPEIAPLLQAHRSGYNDEILPYMFFGDLAEWVAKQAVSQLTSAPGAAWESCKLLLRYLDRTLQAKDKNSEIANLIGAGFAECVWSFCLSTSQNKAVTPEQSFELICAVAGETLSREIRHWHDY